MKKAWQLQEAKNKLSEVVEKAFFQGPQTITRRGKETAVVLSVKDYKRLSGQKTKLIDFFNRSPLKGIHLDLERNKDKGREIDL